MNPTLIERIVIKSESSEKSHSKSKGGKHSGKKARNTKQYWSNESARQRRKQDKVRYDTHRREEQPDERDELLQDIHFANFVGDKTSEKGIAYNNNNEVFGSININMCDKYMTDANQPEEVCESVTECPSGFVPGHCHCGPVCRIDHNERCFYFEKHGRCMYGELCVFSHPLKKEEEEEYNSDREWEKFEMRLFYTPETRTITGKGFVKRTHRPNEHDESSPNKRVRNV
jgi:hypothetical protein